MAAPERKLPPEKSSGSRPAALMTSLRRFTKAVFVRLAPEAKENSGLGEMPLTVSHASRAVTGQRSSFVLGRKMFVPSLNGSVLLWRKRILTQREFSRESTRKSLTDKPAESGSSNGALLEQISPDCMKPKKHVRNAFHNIILSLVSGRGSQVFFILCRIDGKIGSLRCERV